VKISHVVAIFLLFLAAVTWLFDKELKRKSASCATFCDTYEPPREASFTTDLDNGDSEAGSGVAPEPRYVSCRCDGSAADYGRRGFGR